MTNRQTYLRWYVLVCWIILIASIIGWPVAASFLYENVPIIVFILAWIGNVLIATRLLIEAYLRLNGSSNDRSRSKNREKVNSDDEETST
jgi:hypothetical protein